ncbi:MAG: DNA-binding protein WhiA [Eubacterium sp.]|nr:DNA-binding protein WhiA [Eubacterium sp.]
MSFSSSIKKDLCALVTEDKGGWRAELSAVIASSAKITVDEKEQMTLHLTTENPAVAGRVFKTIKGLYGVTAKVSILRTKKFKDHRAYHLAIEDFEAAERILKDTRILRRNDQGQCFFASEVPKLFTSKQVLIKSYLRGAFLGCGSITNPERNYHLELVSRQRHYLASVAELFAHYDIKGSLIKRKASYVLYIKESESITGFLGVIGAHKALLEIENIRIVKEMRNDVNRQVNCETANMNKTAAAAFEQLDNIRYIKERVGLHKLPRNLRQMAEVRLSYPDLTIKELGQKLDPPVGKSGVYHRLKKLNEMAAELRVQNGDKL